jgi:hypothetical protein
VCVRKDGSSTFGLSDSVTLSGPTEPATKRSPAASRAADRGRREGVRRRDVRAGREVAVVDLAHEVRPREVEDVGVACDVRAVIAKTLASIVRGREAGPVDHRAPRAVEHEDALLRQPSDLCCHVPLRCHLEPCRSELPVPREGSRSAVLAQAL